MEAVGEYLVGPTWAGGHHVHAPRLFLHVNAYIRALIGGVRCVDPRVADWPLMHWSYPAVISAACASHPPCDTAAALHTSMVHLVLAVRCLRTHSYMPHQTWMQKQHLHLRLATDVPYIDSLPLISACALPACADVLSLPLGMALMRNRPPMKLKRFAAVHNAFLFSLSLYMSVECIRQVRADSTC